MPTHRIAQQRLFKTQDSPAQSRTPMVRQGFGGVQQPAPKLNSESVGALIGRYNNFGQRLANNVSLRELASELMEIAELAETTIMQEADDWFDGHTIQRNMKEMRTYVKEIAKISEDYDSLHMRARALVDDCGRVLERYFEIQDDEQSGPETPEYDVDGDGLPDVKADNPRQAADPTAQNQVKVAHEDVSSSSDAYTEDGQARAKDLTERIVSLARRRLQGEQLNMFDTLTKEIQIRAAWKIIR
jgi:hypothetical protein